MDNRTKILLGVAVLLLVLYIVGTGAGLSSRSSASSTQDNPLVGGIGNLMPGPPALTAQDIQSAAPGTCLQNGELKIPRSPSPACAYSVGTSKSTTRRLTLPSNLALRIAIMAPPGSKNSIDQQLTQVPSGQSGHVDIYTDGGLLQITCLPTNAQNCVIPLGH